MEILPFFYLFSLHDCRVWKAARQMGIKFLKKYGRLIYLFFDIFPISKQEVKLNLLRFLFVITFMFLGDFSWGIFEVEFYVFAPIFTFLSH